MPTATEEKHEAVLARLRVDWPFCAQSIHQIVNKKGKRVKLIPNDAQLAHDAITEGQRKDGRPQRSIILKARQVGMSTGVQSKLIQRTTSNPNHHSIVVAHDRETGGKLFRIGQHIYSYMPKDERIKPPIRYHKRATLLHFASSAVDAWQHGDMGLDSSYLVDTAGELEAGRGGTYRSMHGSEVAFWPDIGTKLIALLSGIPDDPDTYVALESTANGLNEFKDFWDDAVEGRSDFAPFFWPWWKQAEYTLDFANDQEREDFRQEIGDGPFGEDEPALLDPGPLDTMTNRHVPLTLEQLHWRRKTIANKLGGRVDRFKQEFPSSPDEAFLSTGHKVFDPFMVQGVIIECEKSDPRVASPEHTGPQKGRFKAGERKKRESKRTGLIEVPESPIWVPRKKLEAAEAANWKLWLADEPADKDTKKLTGDYVAFCDPSGGKLNDTDEPDFHAIQVVNHHTKVQVATYRSRIDPDLLSEDLYLAALFFNRAWVAIEVTGGWGLPIARKLWLDYRYNLLYFRRSHDRTKERQEDRLGWSTDRQTKPIMVAGLQEMLREGTHGIRDRVTAQEMQTYVRDDRGATGAESGKYDDAVESYMGAQQVARELPVKFSSSKSEKTSGHYGAPSKTYR